MSRFSYHLISKNPRLPAVYVELEELSREEIIKRFVSIEFNCFADYYRNAPDLNANAEHSSLELKTCLLLTHFAGYY
ncbi:MAG: hypothetical protein SH856_08520 [Flavobacteriales bacterium]|nr:hypothetical protein [Flavobacteriales bacterium]